MLSVITEAVMVGDEGFSVSWQSCISRVFHTSRCLGGACGPNATKQCQVSYIPLVFRIDSMEGFSNDVRGRQSGRQLRKVALELLRVQVGGLGWTALLDLPAQGTSDTN